MVEDDGDDDFGDLYADVEVEASSAINNAAAVSHLKSVIDETGKQNRDLIPAIDDVENGEENDDDYDDDDDDDDDLDIVLNSDDDTVRHGGEGFTIAGNSSKLGNRVLDDKEEENWGTELSTGVKSLLGNPHSMYKYIRSQSAAYGSDSKGSGCVSAAYLSREDHGYCQQSGARSTGHQSGQRFSLPWSRNILDVNIDIFEQKPWKHPGADITDYFNFGFNEDSWKLYCNQVDEYRHRGPMSSETPLVEPAHLTERKGRAIQVEDSIVERQSSMDVRGQLDRDSDVIQITILDPGEHLDSCVPEASKVGNISGDDVMDHLSFSTASEDESVEGDQVEMDIYAPKRIKSSSSKPVRRGSENHGSHMMSDCSGRTDEAIRNSNNTKESMLVAESSDAEKSHGNHCTREPDENRYYPMHTSPVYNSRSHRDSKHRHLDDNNEFHSRKLVDLRYRSRSNSPVYNSRTYQYFKPNPFHENEIRKPLENRYYARPSKAHHEYDDPFPMSDIEGTYDVHSTFGRNRQNERLHAFDPYNEGGKSYLKSELPSDYYNLTRDLHQEGYERYEAKMDRSDFRSSEEKEYYGDRRRYIEDNRMMEGDWGLNERELSVENVEFGRKNSKYPPYLKYQRGAPWRRKGDGMHFRNDGEDDEFCREREFSDDILGEKYASLSCNDRGRDDIARGYVKHVGYTKWEFRGPGRNEGRVSSPSSELYNPSLKKDEDRVLRFREDYSFASRSSEESHIINGRWHGNMMPRNSLDGRHGRYKDQWSETLGYDGSLGDYSEPFDREDYKLYIEARVDMGRKRYWQSELQWEEDEVMLRHEDAKFCVDRTSHPFENVSRRRFVSEHVPNYVEESIDEPHVERHKFELRRKGASSDKYERTSDFAPGGSHKWSFLGGVDILDSRVVDGYDHVEELTDDPREMGRIRYKQTKKVFLGNKCSETSRDSRERISPSCKNSLHSNLVVGKVKSFEKQKPEWMDFNSRQSARVAQAVKTNAHDEGLDIEEGQVITEEITMVPLKVKTRAPVNDVNKLHNKNGKTGVSNPRILEAMAKMEKRRARFNEPISTTTKDSDSTGKLTVMDSVQDTSSNKQQRPARKRRWGGS